MNTKRLPLRKWKGRGYGRVGPDTMKLRALAKCVEPWIARPPCLGFGWKTKSEKYSDTYARWVVVHEGLDVLVAGTFTRAPHEGYELRFDAQITLTFSLATLYTYVRTGIALNLLPATARATAGIITTLSDQILVRALGFDVPDPRKLRVIRLDPFVDFWVPDVRDFIELIRQLPPYVPNHTAKGSKTHSDPDFSPAGVTTYDAMANSLFERRSAAGKPSKGTRGEQETVWYAREAKVVGRIKEKFEAEFREKLLDDTRLRSYLRGQVRLEARHGQEHLRYCNLPSEYYEDGGAMRFDGAGITVGDLCGRLYQDILQGRLMEKRIADDAALVVAESQPALMRRIKGAGATPAAAVQLAHIIVVNDDDQAKLDGFSPRRKRRDVWRATGKSFALSTVEYDVGDLLWKATSAGAQSKPEDAAWRVIPELATELGVEVQGARRRSSRRKGPKKTGTFGFEGEGDDKFDPETAVGPDISEILSGTVQVDDE